MSAHLREAARGEIILSNREGPEAVAYMLMGARHYLCMRFARKHGRPVDLPEGVLDTYLQIVSLGLYRTPEPAAS